MPRSRLPAALVRARQKADGPLRWSYDAKSGTLRKLDRKAYRAPRGEDRARRARVLRRLLIPEEGAPSGAPFIGSLR